MKLSNEFTVAVPLEQAWETLLDIERVAGFLPGAKVEPSTEDGVYRGSMKVKVGPIVVDYEGNARLQRSDENEHVAEIAVEARDTKGQGTASGVIHNRLIPHENGTRVIAETDLSITGRQAQFGRGIMQDIAGRMLDDFSRSFERYLLGGDERDAAAAPATPAAETAVGVGATAPPRDVLDVGSLVWATPSVRRALVALLAILTVAMILFSRRRSRSH